MQYRPLGASGLSVAPVILGGNVFGWTADEAASFAVLDAATDAGLNAIDTADVYSRWAPGHTGGESETIIGRWLKARPGKRQHVVLITKVGSDMGTDSTGAPAKGLSARWIEQAVEASLRRLGVETIDHYFSHRPDDDTPHEETLAAYDRLIRAGKVRSIGASNFSPAQLQSALAVADRDGLPRYNSIQPEYNLYDRAALEGPLLDLCRAEGLGVIPYYGLASGFLSGLYRSPADAAGKTRGARLESYMTPRGFRILDALDAVAARHGAKPAQVALAWVAAQPGLTGPIASATSAAQVADLAAAASLPLTPEDLADLDSASA
ncbi:MAG: aldo/keto reductase [Paracoccaceae bacterium]|nr:aldo/keto reductase [Paracoccaceae bacterium]